MTTLQWRISLCINILCIVYRTDGTISENFFVNHYIIVVSPIASVFGGHPLANNAIFPHNCIVTVAGVKNQ